jgi:transaldolase
MNAQAMVDEAVSFDALSPNIACKIPVSAAGLDAIEELASRGITCTCTTSHTVPQVLAIAEAYRRGLSRRGRAASGRVIHCYAVIMAGRLDDHLRQEVQAGRGSAGEAAITIAGLAVTKRAYKLFQERAYESTLLVGGMRGNYHVTELAGGEMVLTISPSMQADLIEKAPPLRRTIDEPVSRDLLQEIARVPDFVRAYEPDVMKAGDFSTYGTFVKTQGQFMESYDKLQGIIKECLIREHHGI